MSGRSSRGRVLSLYVGLAVLLGLGVLLNLAQFGPLDDRAPTQYRALYRYESDDFITIGKTNRQVRRYYGGYFALAEIAPGSKVTVSDSILTDTLGIAGRLYAFGGVRELAITPLGEDEFLLPEGAPAGQDGRFDPSPYIVGRGPGNPPVPGWAVAVDPSHRTGSPTEFAFLHWGAVAGHPAERTGTYLLIETSLLPEPVRTERTDAGG